jgi:uncharacterized cupredoxin-like copper-binding protein
MFKSIVHCAVGVTFVVAAASAANATANSTVFVTLWDKGNAAEMAADKGIGMPGAKKPGAMGVKLSTSTVPAGNVIFKVVNSSKDNVHEMVVFPYKDGEKIPYVASDSKINEDAAGHLGEVSELDPAKKGELKISLKPGKYAVLCNIPGHYMNGMWSILTVK